MNTVPTTRPMHLGSRTAIQRYDAVDSMRGLCIVFVVLHHTNLRLHFDKSATGSFVPPMLHHVLFWTGSYSVKMFFVISGFLITSSILARWNKLADIDVKTFYRLRWARIAPCLLALLAVLSLLHLAGVEGFTIRAARASLPRALFAALTFHVNWLESRVSYLPGSWDVLWSLSVEETFYLGYPLLCRFVRSRAVLLVLFLAVIIAGPFFRTVLARNEIASDYGYFANMDGIALGCVAAGLSRRGMSRRLLPAVRSAGWLLVWMVIVFRHLLYQAGISGAGLDVTILEIGTAIVLVTVGQRHQRGSVWSTALRWFGRNSYEVYITHMFAVLVGFRIFTAANARAASEPIWFIGILAVSGLLGEAVARWYSEPFNRALRRRI